jgi:hypothetical protein
MVGPFSDSPPPNRTGPLSEHPALQQQDTWTVSAVRITRTERPFLVSDHLAPFALWTAFPPASVGRYSHDYYEACVAIGHMACTR